MTKKNKPTPFTVGDLIAHLQTFDPTLPVGRLGHFGELWPMDAGDFHVFPQYYEWDGAGLNQLPNVSKVLNIEPPDIGEEPD